MLYFIKWLDDEFYAKQKEKSYNGIPKAHKILQFAMRRPSAVFANHLKRYKIPDLHWFLQWDFKKIRRMNSILTVSHIFVLL